MSRFFTQLTISVSLFLQLIFQWNDVYIFGMILFDACPDGINVIRMDQKRHSAGGFAICRPRGRCDTIRDIVIAQKLVEHHPLGVIIKEYVIADMFVFIFHYLLNISTNAPILVRSCSASVSV